MSKTKQGLRDLNSMGPRKRKEKRDDFGSCLVGFHLEGLWRQSDEGNFQIQECERCGLLLASNGEEENK